MDFLVLDFLPCVQYRVSISVMCICLNNVTIVLNLFQLLANDRAQVSKKLVLF